MPPASRAKRMSAPDADAARARARVRACATLTVETSVVLSRLVRSVVRRQLPHSLTVLDIHALAYVERSAGRGPSEVGGYLGLSPPAATTLVERLVARGLLSRETAATDRRRRTLALTAGGRAQLRAARRVTRGAVEERIATLGPEDLRVVERAMHLLQELVGAEPPAERPGPPTPPAATS